MIVAVFSCKALVYGIGQTLTHAGIGSELVKLIQAALLQYLPGTGICHP